MLHLNPTRTPLILWTLLAPGCMFSGGVQTASTLGKGTSELSGELSLHRDPNNDYGSGGLDAAAAYAVGVSDRVDLGGAASLGYIWEARSKVLLSPLSWERSFISVAPTFTAFGFPGAGGYTHLTTPLLFGLQTPDGELELVLSARPLFTWDTEYDNGLAMSVGAGAAFFTEGGWRVMPQLLYWPRQPYYGDTDRVQFSIGLGRRAAVRWGR